MHNKIVNQINKLTNSFKPDIAVVLGSSWSEVVNKIKNPIIISYSKIKGMPKTTVKGHSGNFIFGEIENVKVMFIQGRFHIYEGYEIDKVVLPIKIAHALGVNEVIVTNSTGGINENYNVGDLVIINDQINLSGKNPLIGLKATDKNPIFVDMTYAYNETNLALAKEVFKNNKLAPKTGTYLQLSGPTYETPAEIKMAKTIGADLVGMSTAVEVIMANYLKMSVTGLSCVTNKAAGIEEEKLNHADVLKIINKNKSTLSKVLYDLIVAIAKK